MGRHGKGPSLTPRPLPKSVPAGRSPTTICGDVASAGGSAAPAARMHPRGWPCVSDALGISSGFMCRGSLEPWRKDRLLVGESAGSTRRRLLEDDVPRFRERWLSCRIAALRRREFWDAAGNIAGSRPVDSKRDRGGPGGMERPGPHVISPVVSYDQPGAT